MLVLCFRFLQYSLFKDMDGHLPTAMVFIGPGVLPEVHLGEIIFYAVRIPSLFFNK